MTNELALSIGAWSNGVEHEAAFWSLWMKTNGIYWPDDYIRRLDPHTELDPLVGAVLEQMGDGAAILDVGSGPLTTLGTKWKHYSFSVTPVDPLADLYDTLLTKNGLTPVVRTRFAVAEDLSAFFDHASFEIVHCKNALDHSFDPVRGLIEMLRVAKVGGAIVLKHFRNEAEKEQYGGFHQFNLDVEDGSFVIWNKALHISVADHLPIKAEIVALRQEDTIVVVIYKRSEFADSADHERLRHRTRTMVSGTISHFIAMQMARSAVAGSS
jgi:SAM-dependent methyltransferase